MVSTIPFTSLEPIIPSTTGVFPAPTNTEPPNSTVRPIAPGTRQDCLEYFDGSEFQDPKELEGMTWLNQCQRAADIFSISWEDLAFWNSDLANITSPDCYFNATFRYCSKMIPTTPKAPVVVPDHELPIRVCVLPIAKKEKKKEEEGKKAAETDRDSGGCN